MSFQRTNLAYLTNKPRSTNYLKPKKKDRKPGGEKFKGEKFKGEKFKEERKKEGPYASIHQKYYHSVEDKKTRSQGEFIIEEEIFAREVSPGQIYDFNLGLTEFLERLNREKPEKPPKIQILDNYYLYQYIHSIKDGKPISYSEKEMSYRWIPERQVYQRKIKRIYDDANQVTDLDSYQEYHLIVRIIRFQLNGQIFEIIIPRQNTDHLPYQVSKKFWSLLVDDNLKILNFPPNTNFMIRQSL